MACDLVYRILPASAVAIAWFLTPATADEFCSQWYGPAHKYYQSTQSGGKKPSSQAKTSAPNEEAHRGSNKGAAITSSAIMGHTGGRGDGSAKGAGKHIYKYHSSPSE